jgi:ATP-dependent helicase Lhr and Lhr-like helicase
MWRRDPHKEDAQNSGAPVTLVTRKKSIDGLDDGLTFAHPATRRWVLDAFGAPTEVQSKAWPVIARGENALVLAPTGSGKTLAAFLHAVDHVAFKVPASGPAQVRVLYVSPLKALAVDVERNLKAPLAGINAVGRDMDASMRTVSAAIRTGDTAARDRVQMSKHPPDILITTPESLYLMLTSQMSESLREVQTVIIDEIHSLCGTKRGVHLAVSLERLERLRTNASALQRIGLSATQRPLSQVATFLGGYGEDGTARPVTIVDAGRTRQVDICVEMPVAEMTRPTESGSKESTPSIWPSIHTRLVELIRAHRSTMVFANSRRLAERLATAINELAGEELALAHHGSVARDRRAIIEDRLKRGTLPAIVATSSLELGIDMGAVDLVIQIEAPPTVASGIQRIGRAGHHVGGTSKGVIFPKYRGDLLACAAVTAAMQKGEVESTHFIVNPLDVLAQQLVAICVTEPIERQRLLALIRGAASYAELPESLFNSVLDMLSGRYPSESFSEMRPRLLWDRVTDVITARKGAKLLALSNAGTITERGLYGVFLAGTEPKVRVGELDEEMVFETNPGDVFLLGASSWRVQDITYDSVFVVPAPGEPGRMPFWRGDKPERPLEFGQAIGKLVRELANENDERALARLTGEHKLHQVAAHSLVTYLREQDEVSELPTDRRIVIECFVDEVGDWRVAVLSPFGGRVHAPWATVITARLLQEHGIEADSMWSDDGMIFRLPESDEMPNPDWFLVEPQVARELVTTHVTGTPLFASRFRENAARALLLPRRRPGQRIPLWVQRRKSSDLLHVAASYSDFPIILETLRECLKDAFDLDGLVGVLSDIAEGRIRVVQRQTKSASPFASALMFSYVGEFIYNSDAPLAERRAQALSLDPEQVRLLLGEPELREMLSDAAISDITRELQWLGSDTRLNDAEDLHRMLVAVGDLTLTELHARRDAHGCDAATWQTWMHELTRTSRMIELRIAGEPRFVAVEDAARYRDALGTVLPLGVPQAFTEHVSLALEQIVQKFAKSHGPFAANQIATRYRIGVATVVGALGSLCARGFVVEGAFLPGGRGQEYCDVGVLRRLKRASLAKLRAQIEPVEHDVYARFLLAHQAVTNKLRGLDGVLTTLSQLQGVYLPLTVWLDEVLPQRVSDFSGSDLDALCSAGELVWQAKGAGADVRVAFYLTDEFSALADPVTAGEGEQYDSLRAVLRAGALFFPDIVARCGGSRIDVQRALLELMAGGELTNDTLLPLRGKRKPERNARAMHARSTFRSRRQSSEGVEGRWSLLPTLLEAHSTQRVQARVDQLVRQFGVVTKEAVRAAATPGGFQATYPILKLLEEGGKLRRGYFIEGLGATQFALPGAETRLRSYRRPEPEAAPVVLAALDPANPFGVALPWPNFTTVRPARANKCHVVVHEGQLLAYVASEGRSIHLNPALVNANAQDRMRHTIRALVAHFERSRHKVWALQRVDEQAAVGSVWAALLVELGFEPSSKGFYYRRGKSLRLITANDARRGPSEAIEQPPQDSVRSSSGA